MDNVLFVKDADPECVVFNNTFTTDSYGNKRLSIKYRMNAVDIPLKLTFSKVLQTSIFKSVKNGGVSYYVKVVIDPDDPDFDEIIKSYGGFFHGIFAKLMSMNKPEIVNDGNLKHYYRDVRNNADIELGDYVNFGLTTPDPKYDTNGRRSFLFKLEMGLAHSWAKTKIYVPDADGKFKATPLEYFIGKTFDAKIVFCCQNFMIAKTRSFVLPVREIYVLSEPTSSSSNGPSLSMDSFSGIDMKSIGEKLSNLNFDEIPSEESQTNGDPANEDFTIHPNVDVPNLGEVMSAPVRSEVEKLPILQPKYPSTRGAMYNTMTKRNTEK